MKIAFITSDGETISKHFGRATCFLVVTIKDGQVVDRELREKLGHSHFYDQDKGDYRHGEPHYFNTEFHTRHVQMVQPISDCQVLIGAGMGTPLFESLEILNIKPIVTKNRCIDQVLKLYLAGKLHCQPSLLD